jgi:hypothetical protein
LQNTITVRIFRYLVLEERKRSGGKSDSVRAIEYYTKNSARFQTPDTLLVKTWLIPNREINPESQNQALTIKNDTSAFKGKEIISCKLPQEIEAKLLLNYKEKNSKILFAGPDSSRFGNWYFKVENVKKGGIKLPFDSVKQKILDELQVQEFPFDSILKTKEGKKLIENEVLSSTIYDFIKTEIDSMPENELAKYIKNQSVDVSYNKGDTISKGQFFLARFKLQSGKYSDLQIKANEWVNSLIINKEILFSGVEK